MVATRWPRASRRQPASRSATSRGLSPPGGRKSRPAASRSRMRWPSSARSSVQRPALEAAPGHLGEPRVARQRRRTPAGPRSRGRAPAGWSRRRQRRSPAGSRQARTCARPESLSGMSVWPWMRPSSFQLVLPWRIRQMRMPAPADRPAPPPAVARAGPRSCRASTRACAAATHGAPPRRVDQERADGRREGRGRARLDQQAGGPVRDDVGHAALATGDHRHARRLGLQQRHAVGLVAGWPDIAGRRRRRPRQAPRAAAPHSRRDPLAERREHRLDHRPRLAVADQNQAPGQVGQPAAAPRRGCGRTGSLTSARIIATAQQRREPPAGSGAPRGNERGRIQERRKQPQPFGRDHRAQPRQILLGHRQDQVGLRRSPRGWPHSRPPTALPPACRRATPRPPRRGCAAPG